MAPLDLVLTIGFGLLALLGLLSCVFCFRAALRAAPKQDGDLKMFFWAAAGMIGFIVAGVSFAFILLPIILHY